MIYDIYIYIYIIYIYIHRERERDIIFYALLSLSLSRALGASIAQLVGSRSGIRKVLSSILASVTIEWVTKKSSPKVCGGISSLKAHRSSGPPQPLSRNSTPGWSNHGEKS